MWSETHIMQIFNENNTKMIFEDVNANILRLTWTASDSKDTLEWKYEELNSNFLFENQSFYHYAIYKKARPCYQHTIYIFI